MGDFAEVEAAVQKFAGEMTAKLRKTQHKGNREGWLSMSEEFLFIRIVEELGELAEAFREKGYLPGDRAELVAGEAVDVANFAMMLADKVRENSA